MDEPLQVTDLGQLSSSSSSTGGSDVSIDNKLLMESSCRTGRSFTDNSKEAIRILSGDDPNTPANYDMSWSTNGLGRPSSPQVESVTRKDGKSEKAIRTNSEEHTKEKDMEGINKDNGTEKEFEAMAASFLQANDTSDLRLVVEGKPLYVSRIVLSIISPVLKQIFDQRSREQSVIEIPLPGKSFNEILEFLCCVYPDKLKSVTDRNVMKLLELSDEFKVSSLKLRCEQHLLEDLMRNRKSISPVKLIQTIQLADKYNLETVQKQCFEVATRTSSDLLENVQGFWDLSHVHTATIFLQRLKLFEAASKKIGKRLAEVEAHCSLYHKNDRWGDNLCNKCLASVGKVAAAEITQL